MSEVATKKIEEEAITTMANMCSDLFVEWLVDLTLQEKEIWLWNALVQMHKIKQRKQISP
jgi:hypothetical protein